MVKKCVEKTEDVWVVTIKEPSGQSENDRWGNNPGQIVGMLKDFASDLESDDMIFHIEITKNDKQVECLENEEHDYTGNVVFNVKALTQEAAEELLDEYLSGLDGTDKIGYAEFDYVERKY